jgi:hypothetical protein
MTQIFLKSMTVLFYLDDFVSILRIGAINHIYDFRHCCSLTSFEPRPISTEKSRTLEAYDRSAG